MKSAIILTLFVSFACCFIPIEVIKAKSPSPSRSPSRVPSASSSPAASCGGAGNCAIFSAVQDSFYVENSNPSSDPTICTFGYGSLNYTSTNYNPFYNRESIAEYQVDFTTIPAGASLTSVEIVIPTGGIAWGGDNCGWEGNGINVYDSGLFNEATLIDTTTPNCTAPPTIGTLKAHVNVVDCRITINTPQMLAYVQSTVTSSVQAAIALISDTSNQATYFTTKESGLGLKAKVTWTI